MMVAVASMKPALTSSFNEGGPVRQVFGAADSFIPEDLGEPDLVLGGVLSNHGKLAREAVAINLPLPLTLR